MFIDDYIEKVSLKEELKNVMEQLKTVHDENTKLKTTIDLHRKADAEKTEKIKRLSEELDSLKYTNLILRTNAAECKLRLESLKDDEGFDNDQINISDEDFLKYQLSNREGKIEELKAKVEMLENDRKEGLLTCCNCSHSQQYRIKQLKDELSKSNAEKQELKAKIEMLSRDADKIFKEKRQEGDNLRNRVKELEVEINELNIRARDLNGTISTLLERVSKTDKENQELKKKVQERNDFIQRI